MGKFTLMGSAPSATSKDPEDKLKFFNFMASHAWVGFDLDGTLANTSEGFKGWDHIGPPIPAMIEKVKFFLNQKKRVKIFTARVGSLSLEWNGVTREQVEAVVKAWCKEHIGTELEVTAEKDLCLIRFYDDAGVQVFPNTGLLVGSTETENIKKVLTNEELEEERKKLLDGEDAATENWDLVINYT